ncbi:MAG: hypothetical protein FWF49_05300, partial [Oscillospiraceae bacterium]|nr:hypothetical protein [Oscillospiraceae bacterium]
MDIYHYPQDSIPACPRAVALGLFDGVHLGHRAVIAAAAGAEDGVRTAVFTLSGIRKAAGRLPQGRLQQPDEFETQLRTLGVDELIAADFGALRDWTPEQFVRDMLCGTLHASSVYCGFNYRFGKNAAGGAAALCALCAREGIAAHIIPAVEMARDGAGDDSKDAESGGCGARGRTVSASRIRERLAAGDVRAALRLLGRPYALMLPVARGRGLGRTWGTPTVNQPLPA